MGSAADAGRTMGDGCEGKCIGTENVTETRLPDTATTRVADANSTLLSLFLSFSRYSHFFFIFFLPFFLRATGLATDEALRLS